MFWSIKHGTYLAQVHKLPIWIFSPNLNFFFCFGLWFCLFIILLVSCFVCLLYWLQVSLLLFCIYYCFIGCHFFSRLIIVCLLFFQFYVCLLSCWIFLLVNLCLLTFMFIDLLVLVSYLSFVFCYFDCSNVLFQIFMFFLIWALLSQPHFGWSGRMKLPLPKLGIWSPPGLPNV